MSSIRSTFQHLPGISARREAELWAKGISDWHDLQMSTPEQLDFYRSKSNSIGAAIQESELAYKFRDIEYFTKRLPKRESHRIAADFPDNCVFLDIETTGLSIYYDTVTLVGWSVAGRYSALIGPSELSELIQTLEENPIIVTFNGSLFDLPFLNKKFGIDWSNYLHIDLRYLAKRVGLTGGQKNIEQNINLERTGVLEGIDGAEAVALWFDYKEGSVESLEKLIRYNHADVEGMKSIFEEIGVRMYREQASMNSINKFQFSRSDVYFSDKANNTSVANAINLPPYTGHIGPCVNLKDLASSEPLLNSARIVGIDLTGSCARKSGWSLVEGSHVDTTLIATDEELIEQTVRAKPTLVSIDSPLSIPEGRKTEFDDDPGREEFGIVREAERQLRKRGINSYPALLPSMQKLTARGIKLATALRKKGISVIESYPGAAQDILGIPRKQKGLKYLQRGLFRYGYEELKCRNNLSHDELDAVTCALVGQFMLANRWERLGSDKEDYMVVPTVLERQKYDQASLVVGISGRLASGKTTAARMLEDNGYRYCRFSQILEEMLYANNQGVSRSNLQSLGNNIHKSKFGQRHLQLAVATQVFGASKIVIDGLRHPEDHAFLKELWGFKAVHLHIDAPNSSRDERFNKRGEADDNNLVEVEAHDVERGISLLSNLADHTIHNDISIADFQSKITQFIGGLNAY